MARGDAKESALVQKIRGSLSKRWGSHCRSFKIHGNEYQESGIPDILCCIHGCFVAFEVKKPGKESNLTAIQALVLDDIRRAGGLAEMVTSVEQALELVETHLRRFPGMLQ